MPQPPVLKKTKLNGSTKSHSIPSITSTIKKKKVLFFIGDWNAKEVSQKIPGVTGKFGLGVQIEA